MDKPFKIKLVNIILQFIAIFLPIKRRVFFISSLKNDLTESCQVIYDNLDCEKKIFYWNLPHSISDLIRISYYTMTSKVIIEDNTNIYFAYLTLKEQQKLIFIWHGTGSIKKLGMDRPSYNFHEELCNDQYDNVIVASDKECEIFHSAYNIKEDTFTKIGYPSMDLLIHNQIDFKNEFFEKYPSLINKKIVIYLPTFRLTNDCDGYLYGYDYEIDWDDLNDWLSKNNCVFLIKRHPVMLENNIDIITKEYDNIIDVEGISNFSLLVASDLLITDYSTIFNEYLLLDKPIILYCPDLEDYLNSTGLYYKIPDELPGVFCQNYEELKSAIINLNDIVDYSYFKEKNMKYCDGNSTKNLLKIINGYLEE